MGLPGLRSAIGRARPAWLPRGELADRLGLLLAAVVSFRFSNWLWLERLFPGRTAVLANLLLEYLAFALSLALLTLALRRPLPARLSRMRAHRLLYLSPLLALLALVAVAVVAGRPIVAGAERVDDANAMAVCGARAMSAGRDPYRVGEISCLRSQGLSPVLATPLRVGAFSSVPVYPTDAQILALTDRGAHNQLFSGLAKPPLDPLVMVPVAHLPLWVRTVWTLLPMLALTALVAWAAGSLWPAAAGLVLVSLFLHGSALNFAANGNAEAFSYAFMAAAALWVRRPVVSAVCLALALGGNELAWFFLPGYLLLCLDLGHWRARALAALATLAVTVLPWLLLYRDGLGMAVSSLLAPTFSLGSGVIALAHDGFVGMPPRALMLTLTAVAMVVVCAWGLARPSYRLAAAVLVLAAFWVGWRSLDEYLAQIPLLALATVLAFYGPGRVLSAAGAGGGARLGPSGAEPLTPSTP